MTDHLEHFGLTVAPFSKEISATSLWLPPSKAALVDDLVQAVSERSSVLLTGDPGVGKTCVLRALRHRLPQAGFNLTYCHNATLGRRDFYRQVCLALGLQPSATAAALFYAVSTHVTELGRERIHPVFLLDESHLLHQDTLDHLHILLNYDWDSSALLSLILVGLPELADRLAMRRNRSLCSRLRWRRHVDSLTPEDTADYVRVRLRQAGCEQEIFSSHALAVLHEATLGSMRDIDRLGAAALRRAARIDRRIIERECVLAVVAEDQAGRQMNAA